MINATAEKPQRLVLDQAKIGVMAASVLAAMLGYGLLRMTLPQPIAAAAGPATAT